MKTFTKRFFAVVGAAAASSLVLAGCSGGDADGADGQEASVTLSYSSFAGADHPVNLAFDDWAEEVTEATNGEVQFERYLDASLCDSIDNINCVEDGRADIIFDAPSFNPSLTLANISSVPFVDPDPNAIAHGMYKLYTNNEDLRKEYEEDRNQKVLWFGGGAPSIVALAEGRNASDVTDLDGLNLRATGGMAEGLSLLGASPAAIEQTEIYEALERGVVVGVGNSVDTYFSARWFEVAPNLYTIPDMGVYHAVNWSMNMDTWESLTADQQAAIDEASQRMAETGYAEIQRESLQAGCELLAEQDITVGQLGGDTKAGDAWAEEGQKVLSEKWMDSARSIVEDPEAMFQEYLGYVEEYESEEVQSLKDICEAV